MGIQETVMALSTAVVVSRFVGLTGCLRTRLSISALLAGYKNWQNPGLVQTVPGENAPRESGLRTGA